MPWFFLLNAVLLTVMHEVRWLQLFGIGYLNFCCNDNNNDNINDHHHPSPLRLQTSELEIRLGKWEKLVEGLETHPLCTTVTVPDLFGD